MTCSPFVLRRVSVVVLAGIATLMAPAPARATSADSGVARISLLQGYATIVRGDSQEQVAATVNAPLLGADYFSTDPNSRAEVQFDGTSMLRLDGNTQIRFVSLDPSGREVQLAQGTIEASQLRNDGAAPQIDTPSISLRPETIGDYRVSVAADGTTYITVRSGRAALLTPQGSQIVTPGQTLVASGSGSDPSIGYEDPIAYDGFDQFNQDRDNEISAALNDPYLPAGIAGLTNFAAYGNWVDTPSYGEAWVPNEPAGWSPYSDGSWTWEDGYGWTWVGNEPWGWAPYHYGRWFYDASDGWCWYPPAPYAAMPTWSPALVGFFTIGDVSIGVSFGIGWVPLAPFEAYNPWWGSDGNGDGWNPNNGSDWNTPYQGGRRYIESHYRNADHDGAISFVSGANFRDGLFRPRHLPIDGIRSIGIVRGALPIVPTTANLRFGNMAVVRPVNLANTFAQRRFATNASLTRRVPFAEQRAALASHMHDALSAPARTIPQRPFVAPPRSQRSTPPPHSQYAVPTPRTVAPSSPWVRFGTSPTTTAGPRTYASPQPQPQYRQPQVYRPRTYASPQPQPQYRQPQVYQPRTYPSPQPRPQYRQPQVYQPRTYPSPQPQPQYRQPQIYQPRTYPSPQPRPQYRQPQVNQPRTYPSPRGTPPPSGGRRSSTAGPNRCTAPICH
jgi:hypothetical protein